MTKKSVIIIITVVIVLIAVSVFIYRYQILQYTAETLIRKYLPDYVKIGSVKFDFAKGDVTLGGFKVLNPPGFSKEYLIEIEKIACHYKLRGKTIMDGIEISSPVLSNGLLDIERLGDGRLNLAEAQKLMGKKPSPPSSSAANRAEVNTKEKSPAPSSENKMLTEGVTLPEKFIIKNARMIFTDRLVHPGPSVITFENINTELTLRMNETYTQILSVSSTGEGYIGGDSSQSVRWVIGLDPTTPKLTMSSRFEVSNVLITPLEPYYDRYSPLVFKAGRFSGLLIFDFDNGIIGSSDELRLSGLKFFVKEGYENAVFWETTVPELVKYFTTPYGEVVFDFKIKGDMANPQFFLGPKSKEALVSMAVDKISAALQKNASSGSAAPKSDLDKAKDYIDMFKGLMKK